MLTVLALVANESAVLNLIRKNIYESTEMTLKVTGKQLASLKPTQECSKFTVHQNSI